jgi:SNF2 family DNA or RNA helicase
MTGTILMNSPEDLFVPLNWIGKETSIFTTFKARYCVFGNFGAVVNYMHLDELQAKLESVSLRRTKEEVLDLPPKIYMTEYVELGQKQQKVYNDIVKEIIDNIDKVKLSPNPLTMLIRLRQATSFTSILSSSVDESVKLERLQELIEEAINNDGKVVIYSNWTTVTDILQEKLIKYNPAIITGKTKDRMGQKDKFMTDDTCKICIGTIGALGTGFTLTVANTAIFLDEPYTFAEYEQASDRIYRIGTTKSVNIISLLAKNTIDERVHSIVQRKKKLSDGIVDNAYDLSKPDIVDFLLS